MLTLDRKQRPLALLEWRRAEPPLLAGMMFAGLALVPITAGTPFTPMRVLGLGALLAAAFVLILVGRPRSRQRPLPKRVPALAARERHLSLELEGSPLPPTYRAVLVLPDGSRHTVLERDEPAGVLEDASHLARDLGATLAPGWGIDEGTLDTLLHTPDQAAASWGKETRFRFDSPPFAGQRNAAWTTLWASAFVLVATIAMSDAARSRVMSGALSRTLPGVSVLVVLMVWLWLVGLRGTLELDVAGVTRQKSWFRVQLGRPARVEMVTVAAAFVVPGGAAAGHLVVSNGAQLFAFPVRGGASELARLRETLATRRTNRAAE